MMTFIIDKCERRLKNITYQSDHDLYATYKGYDLQVVEQETGGFYATVKDPKGKKIIDNHVRGLYLPEAVKEVMKQICFKISSNTSTLTSKPKTEQCNIPVRQRLFPVHMLHVGGYFEPDVNTYCQLGDGYDRGFYQGTQDWNKVTCKRCLKHKPNS